MVKFTIRGIAEGIPIRTHRCGELDALPVYEITSPLFWDPSRKLHTENEMATQQGANISKEQQVIILPEERHGGDTRQVNI